MVTRLRLMAEIFQLLYDKLICLNVKHVPASTALRNHFSFRSAGAFADSTQQDNAHRAP